MLGYVALGAAGVASLTYANAPLVQGAVGRVGFLTWAIFLTGGGFACAIGKITGLWILELTGLPLLWSALFLYGGAFLVINGGSAGRIALGMLLLAFGCHLFARWKDVLNMVAATKAAATEGEG